MGFVTSSGFDSISAALRLIASCFAPAGENIRMFLRDQDDSAVMLKGEGALMTSCLVPKPSFYTWKLLKNISGSLVGNGKYYYVIKNDPPGAGSYTLVVMNYNEDILRLCSREAGAHETCDVIASFKDELSVDFSMPANRASMWWQNTLLQRQFCFFQHGRSGISVPLSSCRFLRENAQ